MASIFRIAINTLLCDLRTYIVYSCSYNRKNEFFHNLTVVISSSVQWLVLVDFYSTLDDHDYWYSTYLVSWRSYGQLWELSSVYQNSLSICALLLFANNNNTVLCNDQLIYWLLLLWSYVSLH